MYSQSYVYANKESQVMANFTDGILILALFLLGADWIHGERDEGDCVLGKERDRSGVP